MDSTRTTGNGNHSNNTPAEYWVIMGGLAFLAGFGIMDPIRKQLGWTLGLGGKTVILDRTAVILLTTLDNPLENDRIYSY
jgi:hypothetical protein